jgi:hypothetical protein
MLYIYNCSLKIPADKRVKFFMDGDEMVCMDSSVHDLFRGNEEIDEETSFPYIDITVDVDISCISIQLNVSDVPLPYTYEVKTLSKTMGVYFHHFAEK